MRCLQTFQIALLVSLITTAGAQEIKFETNSGKFSALDIQNELNKYPKDILNIYLSQIVVVSNSKMCGRAEVFSNRVIVSSSCQSIRQTIHHELSSLFLQLVDGKGKPVGNPIILNTLYKEFLKLNGNFKYSHSNDVYSNQPIDPALADYFYISKYATRDFENDFNMIAQFLFSQGNKTISFAESHADKPVARKIKLVVEFYRNLSQEFTDEFFKKQLIDE